MSELKLKAVLIEFFFIFWLEITFYFICLLRKMSNTHRRRIFTKPSLDYHPVSIITKHSGKLL